MQLTPWNERTLPFGRGLDELPVLLERVLGTPARILQLAARQPLERLTMRRSGSWCVLEHVGHLIHLDERMEDRVDDFMARRTTLCNIDLVDQTPIIEGHRRRDPGDLFEEFRLNRVALVERIRNMDPGALRHRAMHPCRGITMGPVDLVMYLAEHDDHHLALMRNLLDRYRGLPVA